MKQLILTAFFIASILFVGTPSSAYAGTAAAGSACSSQNDCAANLYCDLTKNPNPDTTEGTCVSGTLPVSVADASASSTVAAGSQVAQQYDPKKGGPFNWVLVWIMGIFAWLFGVSAITLDNAVYYTVVHMGDYVNGLSAVGVAWRILRDIGNVFLIFGFLFIGIATILNTEWYGMGPKLLPKLLMVAIFINFSLFISETLIDGGNLFATQFYTAINGGQPASPQSYLVSQDKNNSTGISTKIMNQLGLQTIYNATGEKTSVFNPDAPAYVAFLAILLFIIASFVFFSLAFILIARFVVLIFLIIIAPFGFAGLIMPGLENTAKKWWGSIFEQTITAPAMLLMLYVALAVITDSKFITGFFQDGTQASASNAWVAFADQTGGGSTIAGFASILLSFMVAIGLLLVVVLMSKKMGAMGGEAATKWGGRLSGIGAAAGVAGFTGRRSVGFVSNAAAKRLAKTRFGASFIGQPIVGALEKGGKASFDFRNSDGFKEYGKKVGLSGKGQKGGYAGTVEENKKAYDKYIGAIEHTTDQKAAIETQKKIATAARNKAYAAQAAADTAQSFGNAQSQLREFEVRQSAVVGPLSREEQQAVSDERATLSRAVTDAAAREAAVKTAKNEVVRLERIHKETERRANENLTARKKAAAEDISWYTAGRKEIIKHVIAEAGKTSEQKALDVLNKALTSSGEKKEEGGAEKSGEDKKGDSH